MIIKHILKPLEWKAVFSVLLLVCISYGSLLYKDESSVSNRSNTNIPKYFLKDLDQTLDKCHQINLVNKKDQCQFAADFCSSENLGFINYLKRYYCSDSSIGSSSILAFNAIRLITLFTILGIAASDYLSPNLNTTAKLLHIGENLAGLTLLAFGNGSPDLISTFIAMKANSAPLAISELIGAALFITSMVVGLMSVIHPFKVFKFIYIRDTVYFLISTIVVSYFILIKQTITINSCLIFLFIYLLYVCLILIWQLFTDRQNKKKLQHRKFRSQFFDDPGNSTGYQDSTSSSIPLQDNVELSIDESHEVSESSRNIEDILGEDSEYSSLSLSFNPFLNNLDNESSNTQEDGISNKSNTSISSRVLSTADSGYITYRDIVAPGMVASDDNFIYNIHEENEECDDKGDEVANTQFFVRPSLMNALQLGNNIKMNDNLDSERISEINQILETSDNISLKSISRTVRDDDMLLGRSKDQTSNKLKSWFFKFLDNFFKTNEDLIELGNEHTSSNRLPEIVINNDAVEIQDMNAAIQSPTIRNIEGFCKIQTVSQRDIKNKFFKVIFPSLINFRSKTTLDKILTVIILPSSLLLRLTTPSIEFTNIRKINSCIKKLKNILKVADVVSNDNNDDLELQNPEDEINHIPEKVLFCGRSYEDLKIECAILSFQLFAGSAILTVLTFNAFTPYLMIILGSIIFLINLILEPDLLASFQEKSEIPIAPSEKIKYVLHLLKARKIIYYSSSILGFLMSLLWISFLAKEVVSALKFYSVVFSLSDEILGFTVFAVGNSLGDLIANFVIARMGFPRMALAACFGGPLLNILLGVAIGGFLALPDNNSIIVINLGLTLWVSCISLILNLIFLVVAVPNNNWKMNSHIGYVCMCFWITATLTNIIFEIVK